MKAFAIQTNGAITLVESPQPEVGVNDLLVKVMAIGVGIHDGYFFPPNVRFPYTIGIEAAGVVEKVGRAVTNYKAGERITFVNAMQPKGGTWAEYTVVADGSLILRIPESMSFETAAAVPVAGNTAIKAFRALGLKHGDSLFIAGGSGAIGTLAIQIAVARGYRVAASASAQNHQYMRSLGAEKVVDYHDSDWQEQITAWVPGGVDAAIATQPGTASHSQAVVKDGGEIVAVSGDQFVPARGIMLKQIPHNADVTDEMSDLLRQVASGEFQLTIENVYPFSEGMEALAKVRTRHTRGKLVLTTKPNERSSEAKGVAR
jgi:NADPH:quinone reductase-like Zn-dependent oxidoreductase